MQAESRGSNLRVWRKSFGISGFTLLEVMVAMAIIAIALTAVLGSQSRSLSLASEAKFKTTAPLLAQGKLAEIETANPRDLISDSGDFGDDFPHYRWELTVKDWTIPGYDEISSHLRQIDLNVAWEDGTLYRYHLRLYRFVPKGL